MSSLRAIATALRGVFRQQRQQADAGKERFGDWNFFLADKLEKPIARLMQLELRKRHGDEAEAPPAARQRALEVSRMVNATTGEWLREGRDAAEVFSVARVAMIAESEYSYAKHVSMGMAAYERGNRLRWKVSGDPCDQCRSLNGRVVKAGQQFKAKDMSAYAPPLHPHCRCTLEEVR